MFNLEQIVSEPADPELEADGQARRSRQKTSKDDDKSDASDDEELPLDIVDSENRVSNSPAIKIEAPLIASTPASEKALTPQNFSQAVHPSL